MTIESAALAELETILRRHDNFTNPCFERPEFPPRAVLLWLEPSQIARIRDLLYITSLSRRKETT